MGCNQSRIEQSHIEQPLVTVLDALTDAKSELNEKFKQAELLLGEVERIRSLTIDSKTVLLYASGACCKLNPSFITVIESLMLLLATESKGNVLSRQLYFNEGEEPYFSIANSSESSSKIAADINEYIKSAKQYLPTYPKLKQNCEEIIKDFCDNYAKYKNEITKGQVKDKPDTAKSLSVLDKNIHLINQLTRENLLGIVIKSLEQDLKDIGLIADKINNEDYIKKVNAQGKNSLKLSSPYEIVYNNLSEAERYGESAFVGEIKLKDKVKAKEALD